MKPKKKSPRIVYAGMILYVIKFYVPNSSKDESNDKEEKSRYKNTSAILIFSFAELTLAVIGISLVLCSAHRDKGEYDVPENESNTYKRPLAANVQHTRKKRHQYARDEKSV